MTSCTVLVRDLQKQGVADIQVATNDSAGAVISTAKTAADGTVTVSLPVGGMVTAFDQEGTSFRANSAIEPPDGSTFVVTIPRNAPPPKPGSNATTYHVVAQAAPAGTKDFLVVTSCGYASFTPAQMAAIVGGGCNGGATADILLIARDGNGAALGWEAANKPANPGQDGGYAYFNPTLANFVKVSDSITGIPANSAFASIRLKTYGSNGLSFPELLVSTNAPMGSLDLNPRFVPGFFDGFFVTETVTLGVNANGDGGSRITRTRAYDNKPPGANALDVSTIALVSIDALDLTDPVRPVITWNAGQGARGDVGRVSLNWTNPGAISPQWNLSFPVTAPTKAKLPQVPAGLEAYAPSASSTFDQWSAVYVDLEDAASYGDALAAPAPTPGHGEIDSSGFVVKL
jgi:hypothetical protein